MNVLVPVETGQRASLYPVKVVTCFYNITENLLAYRIENKLELKHFGHTFTKCLWFDNALKGC